LIHRIVLPTPFPVGPVNVWLLVGEPVTLIDAGPRTPAALAALESGLAEAGLQVEDLELVVLTHQHADHIGLAGDIRERAACAVAAHELLVDRLPALRAAQEAEDAWADAVMRLHGVEDASREALIALYGSRRAFAGPVEIDLPLRAGETIAAGGRELRVEFRPGHSPTDTLLVDDAGGTAFAGDHLIAHISSNPLVHRPLEPGHDGDPRRRGAPLLAYLESLARTAGEAHELLRTGHGEDVRGHRDLIEERLRLHRDRAEQVGSELAGEPRTAGAIARSLWPGIDASQTYLTLCEVLGALDMLEAEGRANSYEEDGVVLFAGA
jgi:glyoxylase-like metal-dependent hydrolase (beta-lactamase superfamily II)